MNYPKFSVSDIVVCVNAENISEPRSFSALPVEGQLYVIRGIDDSPTAGDEPGVYLVGIFGPTWYDGSERPFDGRRFRKLSDTKDEISVSLSLVDWKTIVGALATAQGEGSKSGELIRAELALDLALNAAVVQKINTKQ